MPGRRIPDRERVKAEALRQLDAGASYRDTAAAASSQAGVEVSEKTVRRWAEEAGRRGERALPELDVGPVPAGPPVDPAERAIKALAEIIRINQVDEPHDHQFDTVRLAFECIESLEAAFATAPEPPAEDETLLDALRRQLREAQSKSDDANKRGQSAASAKFSAQAVKIVDMIRQVEKADRSGGIEAGGIVVTAEQMAEVERSLIADLTQLDVAPIRCERCREEMVISLGGTPPEKRL